MAEESKRAARRKKQVSVAARDRLRNRRVARVCIALIALVVAFAAGFAVRSQVSFVASLGFPVGEEAQARQGPASQKTVYDSITARIEEVEDLLAENSFDTYDLQASTDEMIDALLKSQFRPEFLNRLDEIVFYKPLTKENITGIIDLQIAALNKRLADKQLTCELTPAAKTFVIDAAYDPQFGARPLRRYLQHTVETLLAQRILRGDVLPGQTLVCDVQNGELVITAK